MATLDDKLLGEKTHYYCSSSEDDDDDDAGGVPSSQIPPAPPQRPVRGGSSQTGPKGVIGDWSRYKQLQAEQREEQNAEMTALVQKMSMTCRSSLDDEDEKRRQTQVEDEIGSLMIDDEFLQEFIQKRMSEMMAKSAQSCCRRFESVQELASSEEMLRAIDDEDISVTVVIHVYNDRVSSCSLMNQALNHLSCQYTSVKFCKIDSNVAGLSRNFTSKGLPALLVYKEGALVGNFVRLEDDLCDDFCPGDVENFLIEHGLLEDRSCLPAIHHPPLST